MGSLQVIELLLVAFIMVFSSSNTIPLLDLIFPIFTTTGYIIVLLLLAFPARSTRISPNIFVKESVYRAYVVTYTIMGLFLPLAYVLGRFARGDDHTVRLAMPHLFLLSCQIFIENIIENIIND